MPISVSHSLLKTVVMHGDPLDCDIPEVVEVSRAMLNSMDAHYHDFLEEFNYAEELALIMHQDFYGNPESPGEWVLCSNYEDGNPCLVYDIASAQWKIRNTHNGTDRNITFPRALENARHFHVLFIDMY